MAVCVFVLSCLSFPARGFASEPEWRAPWDVTVTGEPLLLVLQGFSVDVFGYPSRQIAVGGRVGTFVAESTLLDRADQPFDTVQVRELYVGLTARAFFAGDMLTGGYVGGEFLIDTAIDAQGALEYTAGGATVIGSAMIGFQHIWPKGLTLDLGFGVVGTPGGLRTSAEGTDWQTVGEVRPRIRIALGWSFGMRR